MASRGFPKALNELGRANLDWLNDTIQVLLVTDAYIYDEADAFVSDVVANEATGTTRQTLTGKTITENTTDDRVEYDASDPTFAGVPGSQTISGGIIFKQVTNDTDSFLIGFMDAGDIAGNGSDIQLQLPVGGVLQLRYPISA